MVIDVKRHRRLRIYGTPEERKKIRRGVALATRYGWDTHFEDIDTITALDATSHTSGPFVSGIRSRINLEPSDLEDEIETALALRHESRHAKDIRTNGRGALTLESELGAHLEDRDDILTALALEDRPSHMGRLAEELAETEEYIEEYRRREALSRGA